MVLKIYVSEIQYKNIINYHNHVVMPFIRKISYTIMLFNFVLNILYKSINYIELLYTMIKNVKKKMHFKLRNIE